MRSESTTVFPAGQAAALVALALCEDLGTPQPGPDDDLTASCVVARDRWAQASIVSRRRGVVAGLGAARLVFAQLDPDVSFTAVVEDGGQVVPDQPVIRLEGRARALLAGERTALNLLQHLSGVATITRQFVEAITGTGAHITDTRKTTPGLRALEKWAVRMGGGVNHRMGLYDAVLIKENHAASAGGVAAAVIQARAALAARGMASTPVYAEARDLDEVQALMAAPPDRLMLDNMAPKQLAAAVAMVRQATRPPVIEATGGVTLANVREVATTGVDLISIGALTHSAPALDLSMLFAGAGG